MGEHDAVQGFGSAQPGDYYDTHLWKELLKWYAVLSNSDCDDKAIVAEATHSRPCSLCGHLNRRGDTDVIH